MAGNSVLRGMFGQWLPLVLWFAEEDSTVVDGQAISPVGILEAAANAPVPLGGLILGVIVGSEAGSNFGITPTIDGVDAAAAYDVTVNAAAIYTIYATPLEFVAGNVLGLAYEGTVTAAGDIYAGLIVALDCSGG